MFKPLILVSLTIVFLGLTSCKNSTKPEANSEEVSHDGSDDLNLKSNNGERWKANSETTDGIQNMIVKVDAFQQSDSAEVYLNLKSELEAEFTSIFKQCTMEGPAHDQLHNYLFPLKRLFNRLKSEEVDERTKAVFELKEYLEVYPQYFD